MSAWLQNSFLGILAVVVSVMLASESYAGKNTLSQSQMRAYRQLSLEEDRKRQQAAVIKKEYKRLQGDRRRLLRDRKVLRQKISRLKKSERAAQKEARRCEEEIKRLENEPARRQNEFRIGQDGYRKHEENFKKAKEAQEKLLDQMKAHQETRRLAFEERQQCEADDKKKKAGLKIAESQMTQNRRQHQRLTAPTVP